MVSKSGLQQIPKIVLKCTSCQKPVAKRARIEATRSMLPIQLPREIFFNCRVKFLVRLSSAYPRSLCPLLPNLAIRSSVILSVGWSSLLPSPAVLLPPLRCKTLPLLSLAVFALSTAGRTYLSTAGTVFTSFVSVAPTLHNASQYEAKLGSTSQLIVLCLMQSHLVMLDITIVFRTIFTC